MEDDELKDNRVGRRPTRKGMSIGRGNCPVMGKIWGKKNKSQTFGSHVIVTTQNAMVLIARWRMCVNGMHCGIDRRRKYKLCFKLESRKELVSAKNTARRQ